MYDFAITVDDVESYPGNGTIEDHMAMDIVDNHSTLFQNADQLLRATPP